MEIPKQVSGRTVSNRGAHLLPFGHHAHWCSHEESRTYWIELMQSMHMSWCVMLTDGDSVLQEYDDKSVVRWLLEGGIIPIIRWYANIGRFTGEAVVEGLAAEYEPFGIKPLFQLWNEPADSREWSGDTPEDWWNIFINHWNNAADVVVRAGGLPGFPDKPGYDFDEHDPFKDTDPGLWESGLAWFGVHNYGKGRPIDYPYDDVTHYGIPLTEEEYREALGPFADDPAWHDIPLEVINEARMEHANPNLTIEQDDVCWLAWKKIDDHARETLGFSVPMAMTEGGWQPRDRAGTGNNTDIRWAYTTPDVVAEKTLAMFDANTPMFAQCPWLLACSFMGGSGWEYDALVGWAYEEIYGIEKPTVKTLQDYPPITVCNLIQAALDNLEGIL